MRPRLRLTKGPAIPHKSELCLSKGELKKKKKIRVNFKVEKLETGQGEGQN